MATTGLTADTPSSVLALMAHVPVAPVGPSARGRVHSVVGVAPVVVVTVTVPVGSGTGAPNDTV